MSEKESSKKKPLVSVIINNFNKARYLEQCLNSVYNQTYDNIEIVFWDDCSTDNSVDVFNSWCAKRQKRQGRLIRYGSTKSLCIGCVPGFVPLGVTRWLALHMCAGKYVAICDSDDYWDSYKLDYQLTFDGFPSIAGISFTDCYIVDNDGLYQEKLYSDLCKIPIKHMKGESYKTKQYRHLLTKQNFIAASSIVFDKEKLLKVVGGPTHYTSGEDYDWILKVASQFGAFYFPEPLAYYRIADKSLTHSKRSSTRATWYEIDAVVSAYKRDRQYKYRVFFHLIKLYAKLIYKQFVREKF